MSISTLSSSAAIAVLAASCQFMAAAASAQSVGKEPREAILGYAAKLSKPGAPPSPGALRAAIMKAAEKMRLPDGYDIGMRSLELDDTAPANVDDALKETALDQDPRYTSWLESAISEPVVEVGSEASGSMQIRSIGGDVVKSPKAYAEVGVAALMDGPKSVCSGVLIDNRTVLTAAHCLCGNAKIDMVVFGTALLTSPHQMPVSAQRGHEGVLCQGPKVSKEQHIASLKGRDVALLRLSEEVPPSIAPFLPPQQFGSDKVLKDQFKAGNKSLLVVGFGWMTTAGGSDRKNVARVPILSPDCSDKRSETDTDATAYGCEPGQEVLSQDPRTQKDKPVAGSGPCHGDSGGGAYVMIKDPKGGPKAQVPLLIGVVSRSISKPKKECGDGGIFTLLTDKTLNWVRKAQADLAQLN